MGLQGIVSLIGIGVFIVLFFINLLGGKKKNVGQVIYRASLNRGYKWAIIVLSIIFLVGILVSLINVDINVALTMGLNLSIAMNGLLCLPNNTFITDKGLGRGNVLTKDIYQLVGWNEVKGYRWEDDVLNISFTRKNKLLLSKFKIPYNEKNIVDDIVKNRLEMN